MRRERLPNSTGRGNQRHSLPKRPHLRSAISELRRATEELQRAVRAIDAAKAMASDPAVRHARAEANAAVNSAQAAAASDFISALQRRNMELFLQVERLLAERIALSGKLDAANHHCKELEAVVDRQARLLEAKERAIRELLMLSEDAKHLDSRGRHFGREWNKYVAKTMNLVDKMMLAAFDNSYLDIRYLRAEVQKYYAEALKKTLILFAAANPGCEVTVQLLEIKSPFKEGALPKYRVLRRAPDGSAAVQYPSKLKAVQKREMPTLHHLLHKSARSALKSDDGRQVVGLLQCDRGPYALDGHCRGEKIAFGAVVIELGARIGKRKEYEHLWAAESAKLIASIFMGIRCVERVYAASQAAVTAKPAAERTAQEPAVA